MHNNHSSLLNRKRKKKIGLGIPLFKQNAEHCDGSFNLTSKINHGTNLRAVFLLDHVDRMPLGNISDTVLTSILGHPDLDYSITYTYRSDSGEKEFTFNTAAIREELGDIPLNYPDVISFIKESLSEGINDVYVEEY
jgi:hypothetical protein